MRLISILFFLLITLFVDGSLRAESPVGTWKGQWQSGANGHKGPMRAKISMKSDGSYQARFTGRFAIVIPFVYRTDLHPSVDGAGNTVLTANKPLGPILGSYHMQAQVNGNQLSGDFQAAGDNGSIRMNRVR